MNTLMYDTYTIFWREIKRYQKSRSGVLIRLIQPAIWIIVIGNTFSGTQPLIQSVGFQGDYIEFIKKINEDGTKLTIFTSNGTEVIPKIFQISSELKIKINSISLTEPTLDDVFISYTGHEIRDDNSGFNRKREHAKMKRLRA